MMKIAIITARGGSKRIPKKNIREFCGKPIIAYSIEAACDSGLFDEVMVSTDSNEIKEIAEQYGANVPFLRSETASNDFATTADVIEEVLESYHKQNREFNSFCCIYPTAPFVNAEKLKNANKHFEEQKADSLIPVVAFSYPPQRGFWIKNGVMEYVHPEYAMARSQDLDKIYHDCGQFYFCCTSSFRKHHSLVMEKTVPFIVPEEEVQDIDTVSDWKLAEIKYMNLYRSNIRELQQ